MKLNIKTLSIIILLGLISYYLYHKKHNKTIILEENIQKAIPVLVDDKKSLQLAAPKPLVTDSTENGLKIGNNWKSK